MISPTIWADGPEMRERGEDGGDGEETDLERAGERKYDDPLTISLNNPIPQDGVITKQQHTKIYQTFCKTIMDESLPENLKAKYIYLGVEQCEGVTSPQNGKTCYNRRCFAYTNSPVIFYNWIKFKGVLFEDYDKLKVLLDSTDPQPVGASICSRHAIKIPFNMLKLIMSVTHDIKIKFDNAIFQLSILDPEMPKPMLKDQAEILMYINQIKYFIDVLPDNERELVSGVRHEVTKVIQKKRRRLDAGDFEVDSGLLAQLQELRDKLANMGDIPRNLITGTGPPLTPEDIAL